MSSSTPQGAAPMEFQKTIALGGLQLHLATSSRSVDIHGERRATDSSLHAFFFVGEMDDSRSPRSGHSPSHSATQMRIIWYYSPLAEFEKKRLRVEESVVEAAVNAALGLCAASNKKASDMAGSPKMPQVYVRVGKTSTFRKYEYVMASPKQTTLDAPQCDAAHSTASPSAEVMATPPRKPSDSTARQLSLCSSPTSPTRSPDPSPAPPLVACSETSTLAPTVYPSTAPPHKLEMGDGSRCEDCATVTVDVYNSRENGFEDERTSVGTYAEAGLMELPQHPPRQNWRGASGSKPFTPLCDRITSLTNGRRSRRSSSFRRHATEGGSGSGSGRAPETPGACTDVSGFPSKTVVMISPRDSSTPFLSCSTGRSNSIQLSLSTTTLGNLSGSTTNGWVVNLDEGLWDATEHAPSQVPVAAPKSAASSLARSQAGSSCNQPRPPPRLPSPHKELRLDSDAPLPGKLLHAPIAPKERHIPRRPQRPEITKTEAPHRQTLASPDAAPNTVQT